MYGVSGTPSGRTVPDNWQEYYQSLPSTLRQQQFAARFSHLARNVDDVRLLTSRGYPKVIKRTPQYKASYIPQQKPIYWRWTGSAVGGRKKKKDFLGLKGNYNKHYKPWLENSEGRKEMAKQMFDTPLAAERVARSSFNAGDKDVDLTRAITAAAASSATMGLQPIANAAMQKL